MAYQKKAPEQRTCANCGSPFKAVNKQRRFCSEKCYAHSRYLQLSRSHVCAECGATFSNRQSKATVCGPSCAAARKRRELERRPLRARRFASNRDRWADSNSRRRSRIAGAEAFARTEIYERDGWRCGICGKKISRGLKWPHPGSASLDHIIPLSAGGAHSRQNAQSAHLSCNVRKQDGSGGQLRLFG
jgi:5-methylcytosine-specific restriction endonuclease McrA